MSSLNLRTTDEALQQRICRIFLNVFTVQRNPEILQQGGSGIGLSIVKKIIEDHGGKIWATSKESSGTTMYFVIRKYQEVPNEQNIDH